MIRIGTRNSMLAMAQAKWVMEQLQGQASPPTFELVLLTTTGDRRLDASFSEIGTKGIFTKELDDALFDHRIDLAVHSLKDLPSELPAGLALMAVAGVVDGRDAIISGAGTALRELPEGSVVGTSSLRRQALLRLHYPHVKVRPLRGNLNTRIRKLSEGQYDAIIVAAAGLIRLSRADEVTEYLDPMQFPPAIGQGMLGVVCRDDDKNAKSLAMSCNHERAFILARALRQFMRDVEGGCRVPLGCYAQDLGEEIRMVSFVAAVDGSRQAWADLQGPWSQAERIGQDSAKRLLADGGKEILAELRPRDHV